ncbi:hypothetical protein K9N68_21360 [Kovacikia minuta CCNUW1]|uniref:hypothetical protein n=1 Tax=Kovacikia minuta TaxID=2931930 RepID=UPI001CCCC10A|nr:hypothetical protein [Kovacikia minuta]UBF24250.1 hypothetical protein K9N68_21360 [Kovacikia minuta CCNUW1]
MKRDAVKRILLGFLILGLNLILAYSEIIIWSLDTNPGNPVYLNRLSIDLIGLMGFFLGLSQVFYVAPLLFFAIRSRKWILVEGVVLGAILTALLNVILLQID